jgi:hypothetical protein
MSAWVMTDPVRAALAVHQNFSSKLLFSEGFIHMFLKHFSPLLNKKTDLFSSSMGI